MVLAQKDKLGLECVHIKSPEDDDGLDALIREHTAQRPEERRKIAAVGKSKLNGLLKYYLDKQENVSILSNFDIDPSIILTPAEINALLSAIIYCNAKKGLIEYKLSLFATELVKNSYAAGHNEFVLDFSDLGEQVHRLCKRIIAAKKRPINITIYGELGNDCGNFSKHAHFNINGNVYSPCLGMHAEYCSFTISGYAQGTNSAYYMLGSSGKSCSFKTPNEETLGTFISYIPRILNHKIYFIHPDGKEELVRTDDKLSELVKALGLVKNELGFYRRKIT